ncbi:MAG: hypothetical protein IT326_09005 [Anaerolineae bacterium]|nr:hypothetical protein [Anaerolineae bacterium]
MTEVTMMTILPVVMMAIVSFAGFSMFVAGQPRRAPQSARVVARTRQSRPSAR